MKKNYYFYQPYLAISRLLHSISQPKGAIAHH